ncbi:MAG: hypothetical protein HC848_00830 [Limnobacter sp.]|nr:hypothetical protein [Limnobacter sp.]
MNQLRKDLAVIRRIRAHRSELKQRALAASIRETQEADKKTERQQEEKQQLEQSLIEQEKASMETLRSGKEVRVEHLENYTTDRLKGIKQLKNADQELEFSLQELDDLKIKEKAVRKEASLAERKLLKIEVVQEEFKWK